MSKPLKLNVEELKNGLNQVKPALANKEFIEVITHFLFTEQKIIAYNDKICISYPYKHFTKTFSVKATDFLNILKSIKTKNILCGFIKNRLVLKSSDTEAKISINTEDMSIKDMYEKLDVDNLNFIDLNDSDTFKQGLNFCRFSVSKDVTNRNLYCVSVQKDCIISADNMRVSKFNTDEKIKPFLIPGSAVNDLQNYEFDQIAVEDNWVHFKNDDGLIFSSRLVDGDYPDLSQFFKIEETKKITVPIELKQLLQEAAVMAEGESDTKKEVEICLENGILSCTGKKEIGYIKKKMKIDYSGEKINFQINPYFLSQILDKSQEIRLTKNIAYFTSDNFIHLIAISS